VQGRTHLRLDRATPPTAARVLRLDHPLRGGEHPGLERLGVRHQPLGRHRRAHEPRDRECLRVQTTVHSSERSMVREGRGERVVVGDVHGVHPGLCWCLVRTPIL